ncbi:efflux RND transporter periplasmic adaptor subunit [Ramlibacter sp.]|uniref:efflux RND transporter periplasmic adaptor subunit n=1 Tax=Ramlibacter sp. TaxID=1917967 RepID=UPI003D1158A5
MKKFSWKLPLGLLVLLLAAGGGAWWWTQARTVPVAYRTAVIERGALQSTVSASGTVNSVTQVSVGTQVSGQIKELHVDFNSEVKAGQLIAMIDPETFEYRVRQASADVDAARSAVLTAEANRAAAGAAISRAKVDLAEAQRDLERKKLLVEKQFIAQSEADRAQALVNTTREALKSTEAQQGVTDAQVKSAQANVVQRQAALAQAQVDLTRTRITSPVNGIVIKRAIEKGQTVAASLQSPELFVIAQNLQDMQVDASIDESDVGRIRMGQRATFTVDAFPGQSFEGEIRQVRKAAQNVANVVTYIAVIGFSNTAGRLLPGMTANVRVVTDTRESVLKVPNAALRVRLAGVEPPQRAASGTTTSGTWSLFPQAFAQGGPPGGGGGGGLAAMRERLASELQLSADQLAKLDAIAQEMRPKFGAIRDLPEDQRGAARDKALAEMRGKINAMLDAKQKTKYAEMQQQGQRAGGPGAPSGPRGPGPQAGAPQGGGPAGAQARGGASQAGGPQAAGPSAAAPSGGPAAASPAPGGRAVPPPAPGMSGPAAEFRNRLVTELALTPPQIEKVDSIYADARPKFGQLRELPAEERPKARERISAEVRARIGDLLTPEQKTKYTAMLAEAGSRTSTRGRIYLLGADGKPKAFNVRLGITDGTSTELLIAPNAPDAGELKEGARVVTGIAGAGAANAARPAQGPRMPF